MEGTHALSLKVMRVSRPSLATHSAPYFTELKGGPLTEHARASILSLEGSTALDSYPTTLRDYPLTDILLLPASFGSIQLGETFAAVVCVNNDSIISSSTRNSTTIDASSVHLKVEIQSTSNKFAIGEAGGGGTVLKGGGFVECKVQTEMKELGQHVLACTLTYRIPSFVAATYPIPPDDPSDPTIRTLRKYYKFMVTNPLSVKTKVQTAKAPNALLRPSEREKFFLEVHLQNLSSGPMTFQRIRFECAPGSGLTAQDVNNMLYDGIHAGMAPGDTRQYLYILSPGEAEFGASGGRRPIAAGHEPGSTIPLGRLDIAWTSSFGEPGRLLTSVSSITTLFTDPFVINSIGPVSACGHCVIKMLSRKIPPLPTLLNSNTPVAGTHPVSSLPPHMHAKTVIPPHLSGSTISRPQSPNIATPIPGSSSRPNSPFRVRTVPGVDAAGVGRVTRSQSPSKSPVASPGAVTPVDSPALMQDQGTYGPLLPNSFTGNPPDTVAHESLHHSIEATLSVRSICAKSAELGNQWPSACFDTGAEGADRFIQLFGRINVQEPFRVWFELSVRHTPPVSSAAAPSQTLAGIISIQRMEARPLSERAVHAIGPHLISAGGNHNPVLRIPGTSPSSTVMCLDRPQAYPVSTRWSSAVAGIDGLSDHTRNKGVSSFNGGFPAPLVTYGKGMINGEAVAENIGGIVGIGPSLVTLGLAETLPGNDSEDRYGFGLEYIALRKGLQSLGGGVRVFAGEEKILEVNVLGDVCVS